MMHHACFIGLTHAPPAKQVDPIDTVQGMRVKQLEILMVVVGVGPA